MTVLQEPTIEQVQAELEQVRQERDLFKDQFNQTKAVIERLKARDIQLLRIVDHLAQALNRVQS